MRLASGNAALTATSWGPIVKSCPEGPTRLDREIRVGVPARRADGSGRRTAGRWVAPPAVAAVRFSGLRVVGRDSLERDSGRPREFLGALMTPGAQSAGSRRVRPSATRTGFLGVVVLKFGPSSPGVHARVGLPAALHEVGSPATVASLPARRRRLVVQRRPKGSPYVPFRSPP